MYIDSEYRPELITRCTIVRRISPLERSTLTPNLSISHEHVARLKIALTRIRYFDGFPPEIQAAITAAAAPRHFEAGQVIYVEGEPAEFVYILERGWV
jgi:CRP-like cAMP-binding protein